jgi:hypothetical protein
VLLGAAGAGLAGCGASGSSARSGVSSRSGSGSGSGSAVRERRSAAVGAIALHGHPQVVQPVAGSIPSSAPNTGGGAAASSSAEVSVTPAPGTPLQQPASNAQIEQQLAASGINPNPNRATLTASGLAIPPANAPAAVVAAIDAGNEIAHLPYIWGGGHGRYEDTGYDCSGSLSFIFAAAGLLNGTETSGELESFGAAGPGKWITIYANAGHTFAYIAGLRFDTVALAETGTRWSNRSADEGDLPSFAVRHPVGL